MKKIILLGIAAVVALLLVVHGPALLDLFRLMNFIEEHTVAYEAEGPWPQLTDACIGCHVSKGNQDYPSLVAQPAPYLAAQLRKFASGERTSAIMGPLAMTLSDAEIAEVADYFARQAPPENPQFEAEQGMVEKGKQLVAAGGCVACHGDGLIGRDQNPRLAGQGYNYLVAQLNAFASGARSESTGMMQRLAAAASPDERKAMAAFLATLKSQPIAQASAGH